MYVCIEESSLIVSENQHVQVDGNVLTSESESFAINCLETINSLADDVQSTTANTTATAQSVAAAPQSAPLICHNCSD